MHRTDVMFWICNDKVRLMGKGGLAELYPISPRYLMSLSCVISAMLCADKSFPLGYVHIVNLDLVEGGGVRVRGGAQSSTICPILLRCIGGMCFYIPDPRGWWILSKFAIFIQFSPGVYVVFPFIVRHTIPLSPAIADYLMNVSQNLWLSRYFWFDKWKN